MPVRKGATLVEVLTAIFVMGIGMIALLALFPLGAMRVAQAIQDGRTGNMAQNAQAMLNIKFGAATVNIPNDPLVASLYQNPGTFPPANGVGPSYPVLIDPLGFLYSPTPAGQAWVAATPGTIPRATLSWITTANVQRWFGFLDDILFDTNGYPKYETVQPLPGASTFDRDIRYSLAYLCQRPKSSDGSVVDVSTIVFNRRPLSVNQKLTLSENVYDNSVFDVNRNVVTVTWDPVNGNPPRPPVQVGDWILDATPVMAPYIVAKSAPYPSAHGYFYRVVALTDLSTTQIEFEVQTAFRGFTNSSIVGTGQAGQYFGRVIVLEGVAEVFERAPARLP